MSRSLHGRPTLLRPCLVWLFATLVALTLTPHLWPPVQDLRTAGDGAVGPTFTTLLSGVCAALLLSSLSWLWLQVSVVVLEVLQDRPPTPRCPPGLRRAVLAACGLAVLSTGPAAAAEPSVDRSPSGRDVVIGLPLPDRPVALLPARAGRPSVAPVETGRPAVLARSRAARRDAGARGVARERRTVVHGDTLWEIAEETLPFSATDAEVDRAWRGLWDANRREIGADPDLIHPGTTLRLPATPSEER